MGRRGDNIHKRKDGRWEGRYYIERKGNGRIRYGSVYGKTYKEVKEKLAKISQKKDSRTKSLSFKDLSMLWLDNNTIRLKGSTKQKYEYLLNTHILPELGEIEVSKLSASKINVLLSKKAENGRKNQKGGLSASYLKTITLIISSIINFGVKENLCLPMNTEIYHPQEEKKELHILSKVDQQALEQYIISMITPVGLGIMLSLHAGLRIGEVCALQWSDIDLSERVIHIRSTISRVGKNDGSNGTKLIIGTPKTKASQRDIPISTVLFPLLNEWSTVSDSPFVVSKSKTFISPRTYEYRFHKILDKCNISQINYHALRHTFATRCIEAKMDVKTLSEILGHGKTSVTMDIYVHSSMEQKRKQIEEMVEYSSQHQ